MPWPLRSSSRAEGIVRHVAAFFSRIRPILSFKRTHPPALTTSQSATGPLELFSGL